MRFLFLSLAVAVLVVDNEVSACMCVKQSVADKLAKSTVVFRGQVTHAQPLTDSEPTTLYTFSVIAVWKGDAGTSIDVRSGSNVPSCAMNFDVGREYVVYARGNPGEILGTTLCSGNVSAGNIAIEDEQDELESLTWKPTPALEVGMIYTALLTDLLDIAFGAEIGVRQPISVGTSMLARGTHNVETSSEIALGPSAILGINIPLGRMAFVGDWRLMANLTTKDRFTFAFGSSFRIQLTL